MPYTLVYPDKFFYPWVITKFLHALARGGEAKFEEFFWKGGLIEKGWSNFFLWGKGGGLRIFTDSNYKLNFMTLIWPTIKVHTDRCCVTLLFLYKRVLEYLKSVIFFFSSKLNNNKKVPLKNLVWRGGVTRKFLMEGDLIFNREVVTLIETMHQHLSFYKIQSNNLNLNYANILTNQSDFCLTKLYFSPLI